MTPEIVQARIAIAKRQSEHRSRQWDEYIRLLTNDWAGGDVDTMKLGPNIVHSTIRQLVATVIFDDPEFFARALQSRYQDRSNGVTAYMNYLWDAIKGAEQTELVITDSLVYPFGMWKIGMGRAYQSEKALAKLEAAEDLANEEHELWLQGDFDTPVEEDQRHATHIPSHQMFLESPDVQESPFRDTILAFATRHIDEHGDDLVVTEATTSADTEGDDPDMPFLYRVSGRDVFWGGGGNTFEDSRYVLVRSRRNFDEWKEDMTYRHPKGVQPTDITDEARLTFDEEELDRTKADRGMGIIDIWEHYDKAEGDFSAWIEAELDPVRPFQGQPYRFMKGYPLEMLRHQVVPEHVHGPGTVSYLDHPQRMEMDIAHRMGIHVKNASTKWMLFPDRLKNPENTAQTKMDLQNPDMDAIIEVQAENALVPVPSNPIDNSFFQMRAIMKETVQEAVGLNDPARGNITGATATEVREASSSTQILLNDTAKKVRKGITKCMTKILAVVREFGPDRLIVPVFGTRNQWEEFKRSDLVGQWQIAIELPLPGDKQNDLNNSINAVHEMRSSPNVQGEGMARLEKLMLRRLGLQPEVYFTEAAVDTQGRVELEHKALMQGQPVQPLPGEDSKYHLDQHNDLAGELERQLMTLSAIQDPQIAPLAQQQAQILQQQMQFVGEHIQQTQQMQPNVAQGRRRNALLFPSENPGTPESIQSNEIQGS